MFVKRIKKNRLDLKHSTDVIKSDKKRIAYKALFNIVKTIHFLFVKKNEPEQV